MIIGKEPNMRPRPKAHGLALLIVCCLLGSAAIGAETKILKRSDWRARPAKETEEIRTRVEKELVKSKPAVYLTVHHSQTPPSPLPFADQLRKHQELMWHYTIDSENNEKKITTHVILRDTPYHFIIDPTGQVAEGRELRFAPYSNTQYLTPIDQHITIVLRGDFDKIAPSEAQVSSLIGLLTDLAREHKVKLANIGYHQGVVKKEVDQKGQVTYGTTCPGRNLIDIFDQIKAELSRRGVN